MFETFVKGHLLNCLSNTSLHRHCVCGVGRQGQHTDSSAAIPLCAAHRALGTKGQHLPAAAAVCPRESLR